jgi:UDP-N-acetylmuramate: L-alanyl-gamma-D-glutamyl-meso-diaminopimelate ligase
VHYRPRTAILYNLEYDHADIFPDLGAIQRQFHHFVRTVPSTGRLIVNATDKALAQVLEMGCWTPVEYFGVRGGWSAQALVPDGSRFQVLLEGRPQGDVAWELIGAHNMSNALAAVAAANHAGVEPQRALAALSDFRSIKRRLETRGSVRGVTVYDDFAHHPTAIATTLAALRARVGDARIFAVLELRSNTMRMGVHRDTLASSLSLADRVLLHRPAGVNWNVERVTAALNGRGQALSSVEAILDALSQELRPSDHVLIMSNGGFESIHTRLLERLR